RRRALYVSPAYERLFGEGLQAAYDDPFAWMRGILPEDRERFDPTALADGPSEHRLRLVRPDGTLRWLRVRIVPVTDPHGAPRRIAGVIEDVTELERAREVERRMRDERDQLLERLQLQLDAMPIACLLSDADLRVTYANPAAARILGAGAMAGSALRQVL